MSENEILLFEGLPMQLNLSDYQVTSHLGWASAYKNVETGETRIEIKLHATAAERLTTDLLIELLDLKAIGFAGISRKPLVSGHKKNLVEAAEASEPLPDEALQKSLELTGVKTKTVPVFDVPTDGEFVYEGRLYVVTAKDEGLLLAKEFGADVFEIKFWNPELLKDGRPGNSWETEVLTDADPTNTEVHEVPVKDLETGDSFLYNGTLYMVDIKDDVALTANCPGRPGVTFYNPDKLYPMPEGHKSQNVSWDEKVLTAIKPED